jgi:hypothetical protein
MNWLDDLGGVLGMRRNKSLADKVQDAAENVVETVQDLYETAVDTVGPVLTKSTRLASRASDRAYDTAADVVPPMMAKSGKMAARAWERAADASEVIGPTLDRSGRVATKAWERATDASAAGLEAVSDAAEAAAATSAATASAVSGFVGTLFSWIWRLAVFAFKTAILAGVAYAGWQWLQSRNSRGYDSGSSYRSYNSTYGSVSSYPSQQAPASPVGAR